MTLVDIKRELSDLLVAIYGERESRNIAHLYVMDKFGSADQSKELSEFELNQFESDSKALLEGVPLQYVVEKAYFFENFFKVNSSVLIPRAETEELVDQALKLLQHAATHDKKVIDIGTGSGCIAISILKKFPQLHMTAIDLSLEALRVAKENSDNLNAKIEFHHLDILNRSNWKRLDKYDMIISNPPYISRSETKLIPDNVLLHEPPEALFPVGEDPLIFYRRIFEFCEESLVSGGDLILEINEFKVEKLKELLLLFPFLSARFLTDLQGKFRLLLGKKE